MSILKGFKHRGPPRVVGAKTPQKKKTGGPRRRNPSTSTKKGQEARVQGRRDRRMLERTQIKRIAKGGRTKVPPGGSGSRRLLKLMQKKPQQQRLPNRGKLGAGPGGHAGKWRAREGDPATVIPQRASRRVRGTRRLHILLDQKLI